MKVVILTNDNTAQVIQEMVSVWQSGGVVICPTDTSYGISVAADNREAIEKVYEVKARDESKPLLIAVASIEMAQKYGDGFDKWRDLAEKYWPGALSIVMNYRGGLAENVNSNTNQIGVRMPQYNLLLEAIRVLGVPVTTTSANLSGQAPAYSLTEWLEQVGVEGRGVDLFVDGGILPLRPPSTIVEVNETGWKVIRQGEIVL